VEIHGGHGYLLSSFVSPASNRRDDRWGGPLENRARLLLEVVRAVRGAVGPDFAMWVKLDSREIGRPGGITLDDAVNLAPLVEAAGADAITVTAYHDVGQGKLHSASNIPHKPAAHLEAAARIKRAVSIPVIASGRVEIDRGEAGLQAGEFDFLAMGRKLLADPDLPAKLAEGRTAEIRPCIYCYTCVSTAYLRQQVRCAVRPETAFEDLDWSPAHAPERVVVIGGGPAGMEAARRLDAAGKQVTLFEKGERLGGTLQFAGLAYEPNERLLRWLRGEIERSDVELRLNTDASVEAVAALRPNRVIVATGAVRDLPPIPGTDRDHVLSGDDLRAMMLGETTEELRRKTSLATRLATRLGAATGATAKLVGMELAEFLIERGRQVAVVGEADKFGEGLLIVRRMRLLAELREHGVAMHPGARDIRIEADGVRFTGAQGPVSLPADHVVVATGARGDSSLADSLRATGFAVTEIGDGTGVAYIEGAIRGAAQAVAAMGRD
jgi:NADPH-dependent 2,4-dienoyl-CoA reductase/sulfur reductase-like enzyme